jgi:hypothetical protein
MPSLNTSLPAPHIAFHTAHTGVPGLLRSFPVPTPVGTPNIASVPLNGTPATSPKVMGDIAAAASAALASNASLFKGRVTPAGFSLANAKHLSPAARAVVGALLEDESRRLSSIDSNVARPGAVKPANRLTDAPQSTSAEGSASISTTATRSMTSKGSAGPRSDETSNAAVVHASMTLRPRNGSALPAEMRKSTPERKGVEEAFPQVKQEDLATSTRSPDKKKRVVEKPLSTKPSQGAAAGTSAKLIKAEPRHTALASEPQLLTPSTILPKSFSVTDCVKHLQTDPNSLAALCNAIQAAPQPFVGLSADDMARFLLTLAADGRAEETDAHASSTVASNDGIFTMALKTVACSSCLAHRSMDVAWLSDDTIDGLLTNVRAMITHAKRATALLRIKRQEQEDLKQQEQRGTTRKGKRDRNDAAPPAAAAAAHRGVAAHRAELPAEFTRLLEALRVVSRRLASIVADASRGVLADVAVLRVEEIAFDLVTLPLEDEVTAEAIHEYVGRDAVLLNQLVWNRVEQGRDRLFASLCDRVAASPVILRRLYDLGGGRSVMPMSLVFVCAAQSWPLYSSDITALTIDAFHQQHAAFATLIITRIFASATSMDDDTADVRAKFVVQLAEDLCALLGDPSFPVVDNLLRLLLNGLSKAYLSGLIAQDDAVLHEDESASDKKNDGKLRVLVVDAIGRISLLLHNMASAAARLPIEMASVEEVPFLDEWQRIVCGVAHFPPTSSASSKATGKKSKKPEPTTAPVRPLSLAERACCTIYTALTSRIGALSSDMAVAARVFHTRRAYLFTWARAKLLPLQRDATADVWLDGVCRRMSNAQHSQIASDMDDDTVGALATFVLTQQSKSALHSDSREALITLLLQAVKLQQHGASWDTVRKKALSYVSKLLDVQPSLLNTAWPIAVQAVRDDAARVRESSVPLLQKILDAGVKGTTSPGLSAAERQEFRTMIGNVFAALSMLLGDRSSTVLTKVLVALEDVFMSPQIGAVLNSAEGSSLMKYLQGRVCGLLDHSEHGKRYHTEVVHLFASRWLVAQQHVASVADDDEALIAEVALSKELQSKGSIKNVDVANDVAQRAIKELTAIVCRFLSPPFELDNAAGNSGVQLLQELNRLSAATSATEENCNGSKAPRKTKKWCDAGFVLDSMRHIVKRLLHAVMASPPEVDDPGAALAALHAITTANPEWVEGMIEPIATLLTSYDAASPPLEADAATFVQSSRILRTLLLDRSATSHFPLDRVTHTAGTLVAKYSGPLQQRVLVAAIGVLCAGVEAVPTKGSCKQLKVWYQLVNGYYCRAAALLTQLKSGMTSAGNEVGYISRFAFLLSEFLRSYHGWGKPSVTELLVDPAFLPAGTSNRLASEKGGIAVSVQWLIQQCLDCSENAKLMPLTIRLVGSLCIVDPSTYFRRNEEVIQSSLEGKVDTQAQVQALLIVRDFLVDEDARVLRAAEQQAQRRRAVGVGAAASSSSTALALSKREPSAEDANSGMGTWVMQRFHGAVVSVATNSSVAVVRQLAMEIMDVALQQGLIPPAVLVEALIALCADRSHPINSERAQRALATIAERHEDVIAPKCASGIIKSFTLLQSLRAAETASNGGVGSSFQLGVVDASDLQPHSSVHDLLFRLIAKHKKHRENLLIGLMRALYQPSTALEWVEAQQSKLPVDLVGGQDVDDARNADLGQSMGAFLQYLTTTVAFAPFSTEADVLLALSQCTVAVDMHLQSWTDSATKWLATLAPTKGQGKAKAAASAPPADRLPAALVVQDVMCCVGVLMCIALKKYLRKEYGISNAKLEKYKGAGGAGQSTAGGGAGSLAKREARSHATAELLAKTTLLGRLCGELLLPPSSTKRATALQALDDELDEANQEECAQLVLEGAAPSSARSAARDQKAAAAAAAKKGNKKHKKGKSTKTTKKRQRDEDENSSSSGGSSSSSDSSSDESA